MLDGAWGRNAPVLSIILTFLSFFTIVTNSLICSCLTLVVLKPDQHYLWNQPDLTAALTLYITITGCVYVVLLQHLGTQRG